MSPLLPYCAFSTGSLYTYGVARSIPQKGGSIPQSQGVMVVYNDWSATDGWLASGEESLEAAKWELQLCTGQAIFEETTASRRMHASCPRSR